MCDWAAQTERNPRLPLMVEQTRRLPRGNSGSLSPLAAMACASAAMDVFRFLSGYAPPATLNAAVQIDGVSGTTTVPVPPHPDCTVCHGEAAVARQT